jgi:hypothetical protein
VFEGRIAANSEKHKITEKTAKTVFWRFARMRVFMAEAGAGAERKSRSGAPLQIKQSIWRGAGVAFWR